MHQKKIIEEVSVTKPTSHLQFQEWNGHSALVHVTCHMIYQMIAARTDEQTDGISDAAKYYSN